MPETREKLTKTAEEILVQMLTWFTALTRKVTDFSVGSVIRALFEAVALEIEELYTFVVSEVKKAILESAYAIFGFQRLEALPSRVDLTFTIDPQNTGFTLPKGFLVATTDGLEFETVESCNVVPGQTTAKVRAVCRTPGFIGNVPPNTITRLISANQWVLGVTNPFSATGGIDEESESDRQKRFSLYIQSLSRGTRSAILYGLSQIREVSYARIVEEFPGVVGVYISTPSGEVDEAIIQRIYDTLEDWVAAGIQVVVSPVSPIVLDVTIYAEIAEGYSLQEYHDRIKTVTVNYLNARKVGEDFIPEHLSGVLISINPEAVRMVSITPSSRITVTDKQIIRPGTVTVNVSRIREL